MPYSWTDQQPDQSHAESPVRVLRIWPHRSLPRRGFAWFIAATSALLFLPLLAVVGSVILWGLLPFIVITLVGLWWGIERSYSSGAIAETLTLRSDLAVLVRSDPGRSDRIWSANPYWLRAEFRPGPVEDYLILRADHRAREVELGSFLSPDERRTLQSELGHEIGKMRNRSQA